VTDSNRLLIAAGVLVAIIAAFWLMLISPKREESSALTRKVERVDAQVAEARQEADAAAEAKKGFADDYEQLVLLGKAVPGDDDTASFLVQLDRIAADAGVQFRALEIGESAATTTAAPPVPAPAPAPTDPAAAATPTAVPTEASAAMLPIGATVGAAGLGVMPYDLSFRGKYFQIADFIAGLDALVKTTNAGLDADGRLVTIDGFTLAKSVQGGFPYLDAKFAVTTYLTPAGQGVTAGATPLAPAPTTTTTTTTP
jgi:Tfp pilus assembly protein PilO